MTRRCAFLIVFFGIVFLPGVAHAHLSGAFMISSLFLFMLSVAAGDIIKVVIIRKMTGSKQPTRWWVRLSLIDLMIMALSLVIARFAAPPFWITPSKLLVFGCFFYMFLALWPHMALLKAVSRRFWKALMLELIFVIVLWVSFPLMISVLLYVECIDCGFHLIY